MRALGVCSAAALVLTSSAVLADDPAPLDRDEVIELVGEKTVECRKEKDQSLCSNYFSEDGVIVQVMRDDGERKGGVWFVDDRERLCILWKGKIKPLCFGVYPQPDGTYHMIRRERHVTTILGTEDGNSQNP